MYMLVFMLVLNGQVIEERNMGLYGNYIDCTDVGSKIMKTKPKKIEAVFQCRDKELGKGTM